MVCGRGDLGVPGYHSAHVFFGEEAGLRPPLLDNAAGIGCAPLHGFGEGRPRHVGAQKTAGVGVAGTGRVNHFDLVGSGTVFFLVIADNGPLPAGGNHDQPGQANA